MNPLFIYTDIRNEESIMRYYGLRPFAGACDWSLFYSTPGGIIMMVLFALLIGVVIYVAVSRKRGSDAPRYDNYFHEAADIAKKRYARGEINEDELNKILDTLGTR